MPRMIRKQIYIEPEQEDVLKRRSLELGVTEAELIRRGIQQIQAASSAPVRDDRAWLDELAFMRRRARLKSRRRKRRWTREELYEERFERVSG